MTEIKGATYILRLQLLREFSSTCCKDFPDKTGEKSPRYLTTSLNSSELIQIAFYYFSAAPTSTVICVYFMFEVLERCIDLCFVSRAAINFVIGQGMGGKNVSKV